MQSIPPNGSALALLTVPSSSVSQQTSKALSHLTLPPLPDLLAINRLYTLLSLISHELNVRDRLFHHIKRCCRPDTLHSILLSTNSDESVLATLFLEAPHLTLSHTNLTQQSLLIAALVNRRYAMQTTQAVGTDTNPILGNAIITMSQTKALYTAGFTANELKDVRICITTEIELNDYRLFISEQIWQYPPPILSIDDSIPLAHQSFEGFNLNRIVLRNRCLSGSNFAHANLSHANLSHADLSHADLSYADLSHADLRYGNFENAKMESTNLERCQLSQTNITAQQLAVCDDYSSATLRVADIIKLMSDPTTLPDITNFRLMIHTNDEMNTILSWPILPSIDSISKDVLLNGRVFKDVDMSYLSDISTWQHSNLFGCDFEYAMLKDIDWTGSIFAECRMSRIDLHRAQLISIQLDASILEFGNLRKANLFGCRILRSCLKHTILDEACLFMAHIEESNLSWVHFNFVDLTNTTFRNVILWGAWLINTKIKPTQLNDSQCEGAVVDIATIQRWGDHAKQAYQLGLCVLIRHLAEWEYYLQLEHKPRIQLIDASIVDKCHQYLERNSPVELGVYQWLMNHNPSLVTTYQLHIPKTALEKLRGICRDMEREDWIDIFSQNKLEDFEKLIMNPQFVLGIPHLNWDAGMVYETSGIKKWLFENQQDPNRQPLIMQDCIPLEGVLWSLSQQYPTEFNSENYPRLFKLVIGGGI